MEPLEEYKMSNSGSPGKVSIEGCEPEAPPSLTDFNLLMVLLEFEEAASCWLVYINNF